MDREEGVWRVNLGPVLNERDLGRAGGSREAGHTPGGDLGP